MSRRDVATPGFGAWAYGPQPVERLELLRIFVPLAILGFMATRLVHADHWVGDAGFTVPDLGGDWRQPVYLPPIPGAMAWVFAAIMVVSALATAAGALTRWAALALALTTAHAGLADRLAAFTVTKLAPVLAFALCVSAAGARFGVDAWRAHRRAPAAPLPTHAPGGTVRFVQVMLPVFYGASGLCKARGDWLERHDVLWTHLHDSYQTGFSHLLANAMPTAGWAAMQWLTLVFEVGAPLWFALPWTRIPAFVYGVAMHAMIGLMFGPVIWFSLLMITLLVAAYAPIGWLGALFRIGGRERAGAAAS
jgi:uncharacterized membrane protein YphA (DoxX/SURF4 family)